MNHDTILKDLDGLYIDYHGTTEFGDYRIEVDNDQDPENPRTAWDNLGTMICFSRYTLGDEHTYRNIEAWVHGESELFEDELTDYLDEDELDRCWNVAHKKNIILPLYLYDHGGITMRSSSFECDYEPGCVGIIYISLEDVRKEYGWKRITKKRRERIIELLKGEVEIYDHYLTGSVYGYTINKVDSNGEEEFVDSCWGYFGYYTDDDGYMVSVIKDAIKYDIEHTPQQQNFFFEKDGEYFLRVHFLESENA